MSITGVLAAGTADGRLFIGFGGEKSPVKGSKKKSKKWEGLDEDEIVLLKVAEGPIVGMYVSKFWHPRYKPTSKIYPGPLLTPALW